MGTHDDHRERLRKRFINGGLRDFDEHTALELLLAYAIPRKDTNAIAHRLIDRFGSFDRVLEADMRLLCEVEGIGEYSACLIKLAYETAGYYERCRCRPGFVASSTEAMLKYASSLFAGETAEVLYALCLDSSLKLINAAELARGSVGETAAPVRRVVEAAALSRAAVVILAHNHPGGYPTPSGEDIAFTKDCMKALATLDIPLADHVIVGSRGAVSMAELDIIAKIKKEAQL